MFPGDNLGSKIVDSGSIGDQERTNPSLAWLMPKDIMWGPDEVILQSDNINVTLKNYAEVNETNKSCCLKSYNTKATLTELHPTCSAKSIASYYARNAHAQCFKAKKAVLEPIPELNYFP